ncbi:MAG: sn-glycerol-3-phosphate ABC transporter ATP-binding protein UgpC [Magnetospirillum sp.]|nr:sn-glycerol-3-phosphate ABC transporter ATP-binding protein UgpC [Magnetospirillum sp.]
MATLTLRELRKSYGAHEVVHGVSLDVADREFVALVGPSGCGKSTILRMIAGLEDITSGTIGIDGRAVNELDPKDRDIAMVFQDYALYPHMTVRENMAFSLQYRGVAKAEIAARVAKAAEILAIGALLERMPRQLSGGQRQRVAMGRAIVRDPKVFLFDEPLSNLDAQLRVQMRAELKALRARVPVTTIYVTHDQVEAMTLADRIVVLNKGVIEQAGTPEDVYETPASVFVAAFIGAPPMNLIPAARAGERAFAVDGGPTLDIGRPRAARADKCWLGVRPEHLYWLPRDAPGAAIEARAEIVEPLGSDTLVTFSLGGSRAVARLPPKIVRAPGEALRLGFLPEHLHLFDRDTGKRLAAT